MITEQIVTAAGRAYEAAREARKTAEAAERAAFTEWNNLRVQLAQQTTHPLAGKSVVRSALRHQSYDGFSYPRQNKPPKAVQERGIVTLYDQPRQSFHIRGYSPMPGEWYVASKSGATSYKLTDEWKVEE